MGKKLNKEELGNKVLCPECETKFYDLAKTPIVCPSCEFSFSIHNQPEEKTDENIFFVEKYYFKIVKQILFKLYPCLSGPVSPTSFSDSHTRNCYRPRSH